MKAKFLPQDVIDSGEEFSKKFYSKYFKILDVPFVLICILGPWWTIFIALLYAGAILLGTEESKILKRHQKTFWNIFACAFLLSGILFYVLLLGGIQMPWLLVAFVPEFLLLTPLSKKAELAYYNDQGYDYEGHLGVEL